jgi:hypothetical protein
VVDLADHLGGEAACNKNVRKGRGTSEHGQLLNCCRTGGNGITGEGEAAG